MPDRNDKKDNEPKYGNVALMSAPTMLIVFPLVGWGLGYLAVKYWHWPAWVQIVTLLMGLVQGMREVYRLGMQIEKDDKNRKL